MKMTPETDNNTEAFCNGTVCSFKYTDAKIRVKIGTVARIIPASEEEA